MRKHSVRPLNLAAFAVMLVAAAAICLTSCTATYAPAIPGSIQAHVTRVVDGDTIVVNIQGKDYKLRYIGMDTPETVNPDKPVQFMGKEASRKNLELVGGKTVTLEKDISETDRYGRLLRYVWVDGLMVNAELVRLGYAHAYTYPPDIKYQDVFRTLEKEARENRRGLWAENTSK
jgi:micrococcal nuclease